MHVSYNKAVEEQLNASFALMDINSLKSYAQSQRQWQWEIKIAIQKIENIIIRYRESQDDICTNCCRFTSAEDIKCHSAKSFVMASGSKDAFLDEVYKIEEEETAN